MELTEIQIQELFAFTKHKLIEHYDIQSELVDHLANDIENILSENSDIDFAKAKQIAYKKFGIYGFSDIVAQKENQLTQKYFKILFNQVIKWLESPKNFLAVLITFIFYFFILKTLTIKSINVFIVINYIFFSMTSFVVVYNYKKNIKKEKKWLLKEIIYKRGIIYLQFLFMMFMNMIGRLFENFSSKNNDSFILTFSVCLTLQTLLFFVCVILLPKKSDEILKQNYPEYV